MRGGFPGATRAVFLIACLTLTAACASPVGVKRVDARSVHRQLTANVLSTGEPSAPALHALHARDAYLRFQASAAEVLAQMHRELALGGVRDPDLLFALAELSFAHADGGGGPPWYRASAVYAYAFLFSGGESWPPDPFDPRFRLAVDLYNRGLTEGLRAGERGEGDHIDLDARRLALPFGELELRREKRGFRWFGHRLHDFVPAAELDVRGLRNRYRTRGIGAPVAASYGPIEGQPVPVEAGWLPPSMKLPATVFVRIEDPRTGIGSGRVVGVVELFTAERAPSVRIAGHDVPLESEPTAALAYSLSHSRVWELELRGYRSGDFHPLGDQNLVMFGPHRRGRIPLVLVHGTASSPGRWAEMINELNADPVIRERYEFWLFFYNTGNPILYSASQLRAALSDAVARLDPEGTDSALRRMVVAGHSQGGLITRLMVVHGGDVFWSNVSESSIDELDLEADTEALLNQAFFFEPLPFVERVIFIATPHRGSFLAGRRLATLANRIIQLPGGIVGAGQDLFDRNPSNLVMRRLDRLPTSVDNMTPGHPFIVTLSETTVTVEAHSIVAVKGRGPVLDEHDGVVSYSSAHLEGVVSEKIVHSGHSVQGHPECIAEMRRILRSHVGKPIPGAVVPRGPGAHGRALSAPSFYSGAGSGKRSRSTRLRIFPDGLRGISSTK